MSQTAHKNPPPHRLSNATRKVIAIDALSGGNISQTARKHEVSRNSVYAQQRKAHEAIDRAYSEPDDDKVLFYLPVTMAFIHQFILTVILICKGSFRESIQATQDLFDVDVGVATVHRLVNQASEKAKGINASYDLSLIKNSSSDEVFHMKQPILTVVDIQSRYCAMLVKEEQRDGDSWGVHLLDIMEQGFNPTMNISDLASGMRSGFEMVLENTELRADHFHLIFDAKKLIRLLKNRKETAITMAIKISIREEKANAKNKPGLTVKLEQALRTVNQAETLYRHVSTVVSWLQHDVLQLAGLPPKEREDLYDFIVAELESVADQHHRIASFLKSLKNQKSHLLAVSNTLDKAFQILARQYNIDLQDVWDICITTRYSIDCPNYHVLSDKLERRIGPRYDDLENEVLEIMDSTPRCSSMVENFNSRLRPYLDSRKTVTTKRLGLYQFILNHRPFQRSEKPELVGKTPAEALTGKSHPHWLEMLGYSRFKRAA